MAAIEGTAPRHLCRVCRKAAVSEPGVRCRRCYGDHLRAAAAARRGYDVKRCACGAAIRNDSERCSDCNADARRGIPSGPISQECVKCGRRCRRSPCRTCARCPGRAAAVAARRSLCSGCGAAPPDGCEWPRVQCAQCDGRHRACQACLRDESLVAALPDETAFFPECPMRARTERRMA